MNYRQVIKDSWEFTQENKRLIIWYGFLPALLTTLVGVGYVLYQIVATYKSPAFSPKMEKSFLLEIFEVCLEFIKANPQLGITLAIVAVVVGLLYLFIPTICQGGLIQIIARMQNQQKVRIWDGLTWGLLVFLPLFEYHLLIKGFSFFAFVTEATFIVRNLGLGWFQALIIPIVFFMIISFILLLLFTYTEYFIVVDHEKVFKGILKSARLVLLHWQETFLLLILMLIITLRIIFNVVLALLLPAIIILPAWYLTTVSVLNVAIGVGIVIGILALSFAAYLGGILEVFATTVWVKTFLHLTEHGEVSAREKGVNQTGQKEEESKKLGVRDRGEEE